MRAARTDANQTEIVEALRRLDPPAMVQSLSGVGVGCPDLLVWWGGRWEVMEVKDGDKPPSERQLTEPEKKWHKYAKQHGARVHIVESAAQAVAVMAHGEAVTMADSARSTETPLKRIEGAGRR